MSRIQYFAGYNVVQDYNASTSLDPFDEKFGSTIRSQILSKENLKQPNNSNQIKDNLNFTKNNDKNKVPEDLGEPFVKRLLEEFKRSRGVETHSPQALMDFWKLHKQQREKEEVSFSMSRMSEGKFNQSGISVNSRTSDRIREIRALTKFSEDDVFYTLSKHTNLIKQEDAMKKFFLKEQNKNEETQQKKQKKKMSKETLERLYPVDKLKNTKKTEDNEDEPQDVRQKRQFVESIIQQYKRVYTNSKNFRYPETIKTFWNVQISDKPDYYSQLSSINNVISGNPNAALDIIDDYFYKKLEIIDELRSSKYGFKTDEVPKLIEFYGKELKEEDKTKNKIDFEEENMQQLFEEYVKKKKEIKKREEEEARIKSEREFKIQKEYLLKQVLKKDIEKTPLDKLAQPKDKLTIGRTIMLLKKMFPNDKILRKMLLDEFKQTKLLKYPEEYDVYDSDDEIEIRTRDHKKEPYKSAQNEGRKQLNVSDIEKPIEEREKQILEPFDDYVRKLSTDMEFQIENEKRNQKKQEQEDKKLDRFIQFKVRSYINMRKIHKFILTQKMDPTMDPGNMNTSMNFNADMNASIQSGQNRNKIKSVRKFLIETYRQMKEKYPEATKRKFPHCTYGYSRRLKKQSYPVEFKRYFFFILRAMARGNRIDQGKELLPFWAPPSAGSKAKIFLDTNQTYNKKVNDTSKLNKLRQLEADYEKTNCWTKDEFEKHKLNIMMKFDDAKNCTFTPSIGTKMPKSYKELILDQYHSWGATYLNSKSTSFEGWVSNMGNNFASRFPIIFKYGKYKRALNLYKENKYIEAYKQLAEAFNIPFIKKTLEINYKPENDKNSMFSEENLRLTFLERQEDFDDKANERFLGDVYQLIKAIEYREYELKKSMKEIKSMLEGDNFNQHHHHHHHHDGDNKQLIKLSTSMGEYTPTNSYKHDKKNELKAKTLMCPLGDKCKFDIRPRWPISNTNTVKKFGSHCDLAHHIFELKFQEEIKGRKRILKNMLEEIKKKFEMDPKKPAWNPGGSNFTACIGCGEINCATCGLRKILDKKFREYLKKARDKYGKITAKPDFEKKYSETGVFGAHDIRFKKKLGYYRRACILYESQRYNDAYQNIIRAIEIIKQEKSIEEENNKKEEDKWRAKLGIPPGLEVTPEMIYETNPDEGFSEASGNGALTQGKLKLFAQQTGIIGGKKADVNAFLNIQIEELYNKIEKEIERKMADIKLMQTKIEKLENGDGEEFDTEEQQQQQQKQENPKKKKRLNIQKTEMCPNVLNKGKCTDKDCLKAHNPIELDLIDKEKKIVNLQKTITLTNKKIEEGKPPAAWRPTSAKDAIMDIHDYDEQAQIKKMATSPKKKDFEKSRLSKTSMSKTSVYDLNMDTLQKMPWERSKSPNKR